jgi:hypothetical protein
MRAFFLARCSPIEKSLPQALSFPVMQNPDDEAAQSASRLQFSFPLISRRDLIRSALLAGMVPALGPALSFAQAVNSGLTAAARGEDGSKVLTDPNWKAAFLNDQQNETLIALSDVVIPATDTPGAKDALVNRYLDLLLSIQPAKFQQQFVDALAFVDTKSQEQFGKDFRSLAPDDQIWLLTPWAYPRQASWFAEDEETPDPGPQHFQRLKALIAAAYYGSEIGQKELGWDGNFTEGPYQGCEHPAGHHT